MRPGHLAAIALLFASCNVNSLDGSISEAFDLSFTDVQIRRGPTAVEISYSYGHTAAEPTARFSYEIIGNSVPVHPYQPGTWGPEAVNDVLLPSGGWHAPLV